MRQATPFSAAITWGDRLLVIVRNDLASKRAKTRVAQVGQIFAYMLDALFSDAVSIGALKSN